MKNFWLTIKNPILVLAPMAGITDSSFCLLCRENGADVVYTEMTSIDALYYDSKKTIAMLARQNKAKPIVLQLFGKRPELVSKAVEIVEQAGFDGIDINFGCPAKKVVAHEGGITLLRSLNLCHELVQAVCEATKLPVSVKTRVSIDTGKKQITVLDFIDKIKNLSVSTLMLHGRTYEQAFGGEVDYEMIKQAKKKFNGLVIGNGGLNNPEDAKKMLDQTGVDGIALARGVYGRPWLFQQTKDYLRSGKYTYPNLNKVKKIVLRHAELNFKAKNSHGIIELRKHLCWYFRGFPGAGALRSQLVRVESVRDIKSILKKI